MEQLNKAVREVTGMNVGEKKGRGKSKKWWLDAAVTNCWCACHDGGLGQIGGRPRTVGKKAREKKMKIKTIEVKITNDQFLYE